MKEKIIIIGGGGHAKVIISILSKTNNFEIIGYTELEDKGQILNVPYLGVDVVLSRFKSEGVSKVALGVGQIKSTVIRKKLVTFAKNLGFSFPVIISPDSIVNQEVRIGEGTVVMDGAIVNSGSIIGDYSIINTKASVDHDCRIGSFTHIAPGVTLSGDVSVGDEVLLGTASSVIQGIHIPDRSIVAAGSSVQKPIKETGIYRGVPARLIRKLS